jgi:putative oxidoreductase
MKWAETYVSWQPRVLSVLRIMTGLLFLQYGMAKLLKFPAVPAFKDVTLFSLYGLAGTLELVGGALMILGLFTRPVAFILAGEMAFAYFIGHAPRGFLPILNGGNLAILFCFVFSICPSLAPDPGVSMPCEKTGKSNSSSAAERCRIEFETERRRERRAA